MPLLKELGGQRDEVQNDEAIVALCLLSDEILGGATESWISSADLVERAKHTDGITWIASKKSLATFMSKLGLYPQHFRDEQNKQKRGYKITSTAIDDIKLRYVPAPFPSLIRHIRHKANQIKELVKFLEV